MIIKRRSKGDRLKGPMVNPISPGSSISVSNVFGPRPFSPHIGTTGYDYDFHRGVDFPNAPEGTPCYAATAGAVIRKNYTHFHWKNSSQLNEFEDLAPIANWSLSVTDKLNISAEGVISSWNANDLTMLLAKNAVIYNDRDNWVLEIKLEPGFSTEFGELGFGVFSEGRSEYAHLSYNGSVITIRGVSYNGPFVDDQSTYLVSGVIWLRLEYDFPTETLSWKRSSDGNTWITLGSEVGYISTNIVAKPALTWCGNGSEEGTDEFAVLEFNWIDETQTVGRFGNWISINREEGKITQVHLSTVDVNLGDFITAGTRVGTIGRTGFNTRSGRINGVHAHLEWSDVTIAAYSQDEALNPLESDILPRINVSNNISLTLSEENDPDSDAAWRIDVEVLRGDSDFDFNELVITGNAASRTINFNTKAGLNPDNDIPWHDGVYIVPEAGFNELSASYNCTFYVKKSSVGSASIDVEAYDCNDILCDSASLATTLLNYNVFRSYVSDDAFQTVQAFAPAGRIGVVAVVSIEEVAGAGTFLDLGGVTSGVVQYALLRAKTSTNELEVVFRTNGGVSTQVQSIGGGTWLDGNPRFVWIDLTPAATNAPWRIGVGAPSAGTNKSGVIAGGVPTTASAQPIRMWTATAGETVQSAGSLAFAVLNSLPSDTILNTAPTTGSGLYNLVDSAIAAGAVLIAGAQHSITSGEVETLIDPSGNFTWSKVIGTRPSLVSESDKLSYSLGSIKIGLSGQSNARGGHTETAETITLPGYTLVQSTGTTVNTGSNITAYGPDLGIIATMGQWASAIEIGKHAVGASEITTWIGAGANKTTWYAVLDAMSSYPTDIIWVHGEADSIDLANANAYGTRLATWASETRAKVGAGCRLHIADLGTLPAGYPHAAIVRQAIRDYVLTDPLAFLISVDGLGKVADAVHYTGGSTRRLGYRCALSIAQSM